MPKIFEDIYAANCTKIALASGSYNSIRDSLSNTEYNVSYSEPTKDHIGSISVTDTLGNRVDMIFYPLGGEEILTSVEYLGDTKVVGAGDNYHNLKKVEYKAYSKTTANKKSNAKDVFSLQGQREFLSV